MPRTVIQIFEIKSPGLFYGREVPSEDSEEGRTFKALERKLQSQFNNEQLPNIAYNPSKGEVCVGRRSSDKKWCRVEVGATFLRSTGHQAQCHLLDYGTDELIPTQWLRKSIPSMCNVPFQVKTYCLYGIQALTMAMHEDCTVRPETTEGILMKLGRDKELTVPYRPCLVWDNAALVFMQQLVKKAHYMECEVKHTDHEGKVHIILYLRLPQKEVCLNDELVMKNYGIRTDEKEGDLGEKKKSELLKLRSKLKAQATGSIKSKLPDNLNLLKDSSRQQSMYSCDDELSDQSEVRMHHVNPDLSASRLHHSDPDQSERASYFTKVDGFLSRIRDFHSDTDQLLHTKKPLAAAASQSKIRFALQVDSSVVMKSVSGRSEVPPPSRDKIPNAPNMMETNSNSSGSSKTSSSNLRMTNPLQINCPRFSMINKLLNAVSPQATPMATPLATPTCLSDSEVFKYNPPGITATSTSAGTDMSSTENLDRLGVQKESARKSPEAGLGRGIALMKMIEHKNRSPGSSTCGSEVGCRPAPAAENLMSVTGVKEDETPKEVDQRSKMMGQLQGKRLLENLSGKSSKSRAEYSKKAIEMAQKDGVLIQSSLPCHPIYRIDEAPLHSRVQWVMQDVVDSDNTTLLQAYAWQPILRGEHVVGIAPLKTGGKTLAYLAPLLTALLQPLAYEDLPAINGPLAIILVHSWKKAQELYDISRRFLASVPKPRVLAIYGGGAEKKHYVSLINGCELLIATPPSLLRMIQSRYVLLDRLCHLVADDADTLFEEYTQEVQNLMKNYSLVLSKDEDRTAPQQIVVMSSQWCPAVESYINAFMADPSIIITSKYEAAVYGRVKQVLHFCSSNKRIQKVTNLLDSLGDGVKTVIFCSSVNKVLELIRFLKAHSVFAIEVHSQMELHNLEYKVIEWNEAATNKHNSKIMVCDDRCCSMLRGLHLDAQIVIHYDMAESKTQFGNRLACMSENYSNPLDKKKKPSKDQSQTEDVPSSATSHVIFTEQCQKQARSVYNLLRRIKCKVPRQLKNLMLGMREGLEENTDKDLCLYLKAYGVCKQEHKCGQRHTILPDIDMPVNEKLTSGMVKVKIVNVVDASRYFARILKHRVDDTTEDFTTDCLKLYKELTLWFSSSLNRIKHANICSGDLCAYEEANQFHRVEILDLKDTNARGGTIKALVQFVDEGRIDMVSVDGLYELPAHIKEISFQTMEVYICRIRPVDKDEDWTINANTAAHDIVENKVLEGRIVLRTTEGILMKLGRDEVLKIPYNVGNTLWLDPLVDREYLPETKVWVNKMFVRTKLLHDGYAVNNPSHIQKLYEICQGKIFIPESNKQLQNHRPEESIETDELPESLRYVDVYLSEMDMPDLVFLQRDENVKRMEALEDEMNNRLKDIDPANGDHSNLNAGNVCLAKLDDGKWYRVKILQTLGTRVEVFCADYGDKETVDMDQICPMSAEFSDLPFQAIECQLAHVKPRGENWPKESGDALWDMTHFVNEDKKKLVAKVVSKSPSTFAGKFKYEVELYDTSTADDVDLAQELVWSGLAAPVEGSKLRELCPLPPFILRKLYKHPVQRILDLCACIYWNKDQKRPIAPHEEILAIVTDEAKSDSQSLITYGGVAPIIKLIGRLVDPTCHNNLMEALLLVAETTDRLAEELLNQDGALSIIKCLEQKSRPEIQEQATNAIIRLIAGNERFAGAFSDSTVLEILCDLLDSVSKAEIQVGTCRALSAICAKSKNASDLVHHFKVCTKLQQCLSETEREDFTEALLTLLATLAKRNGKQDQLLREKLARAVSAKLEKFITNEMCLISGAKYFLAYCKENRKLKTSLLELGVALIYQRAVDGPISTEAKKACQSVIAALVVQVPKSSLHAPQKATPVTDTMPQSSQPPVLWSQNFAKIILRITLPSVRQEDNPIMLSETEFSFRAKVEGKVYAVNYTLYGKIVPSLCKNVVRSSEVLVSLRKAEKGRWKRLLQQEHKPQNLSIDFERYVDTSSDNEEIDSDEEPFILKKNTRKLPSNLSRPATLPKVPSPRESTESSMDSDEDNLYGADFGVPRDEYRNDPYDLFNCREDPYNKGDLGITGDT